MWCPNLRHLMCLLAGALALMLGTTAGVNGQTVIPIDDFSHMDPALPGWTKIDLSANQPWGPGEYDPSSGALRIYHSGSDLIPPDTPFQTTAMFASWNDSIDPLFSHGLVRAQIRIRRTAKRHFNVFAVRLVNG